MKVNDQPQNAPENFHELEPKVVTSDGDGLWETWHGSGIETDLACGDCGNTEGNRQIYGNWGHSYPNGNSWNDKEILCGKCQKFTSYHKFSEG